jgi:hypothetical protein
LKSEGDTIWQNTSLLRAAAATSPAEFDYATFFQSADRMDRLAREAKEGAAGLNGLAGQLYVAWDKLLLEVDKSHDPPGKVRVVQTKFPDASLTNGQVTSEERWENVVARFKEAEDGVGMVVERKAAGKYDSEAERVVEPPAYARMAPPGQSNQYGSWQNGVWHWLPQYLILSQLLNMNRGRSGTTIINAYDQARRRGEVFYGRNNEWRRGGTSAGGGVLGRARDWASRQSRDASGGGFLSRAAEVIRQQGVQRVAVSESRDVFGFAVSVARWFLFARRLWRGDALVWTWRAALVGWTF